MWDFLQEEFRFKYGIQLDPIGRIYVDEGILLEENTGRMVCVGHYQIMSPDKASTIFQNESWFLRSEESGRCPYLDKILGYFLWSVKAIGYSYLVLLFEAVINTCR
jgi:hypothetical protein